MISKNKSDEDFDIGAILVRLSNLNIYTPTNLKLII